MGTILFIQGLDKKKFLRFHMAQFVFIIKRENN